jgi:phosphoribosylamine--glycine ligase
LVVNGGRVLCVTALAHNIKTAQKRVYEIADQIDFDGKHMRRDIGSRSMGIGALLAANGRRA